MKKIYLIGLICLTFFIGCENNTEQLSLCKSAYHAHNNEKIIEICEPLSKKGNADATIMLASAELSKNHDDKKTMELLSPLLAKNDAKAICLHGVILLSLNNIDNIRKAVIHYIKDGLEKLEGDIEYDYLLMAKYALAKAYYTGKDIEWSDNQDYKKAINLLKEITESKIFSEVVPDDIKGDIYMILGTSYFMGITGDNPANNDIAYEYWQKAYKLGNIGAIPLIEYYNLDEYFITMQAYKQFDRYYNDNEKIKEYQNWLYNGNGQKYLIKNESMKAMAVMSSMFWYDGMAKDGYLFARWNKIVNEQTLHMDDIQKYLLLSKFGIVRFVQKPEK